ncbi:MAG: prenyltransferase/squalene oxidase repeat-containing protein [Planctomycetaceae bacterium]
MSRQLDPVDPEPKASGPLAATEAIRQAPAWAISMLVHVVALLAMALIVSTPPQKDAPRVITSSNPETEDEFTEFQDELPEQPRADVADPMEVAVATEVPVTDVDVVTDAEELDAAPLAVEFTDFGSETAPATDMMQELGAIGGTAGGLGGRAQAAKLAATSGGGGDTERAVDRSLKWIISHQLPDGGWSFDMKACPSCGGRCSGSGGSRAGDRTGATAMALLPFLGRGYTHREGPYKLQVNKGITFLAQRVMAGKGRAYDAKGNLYSQGLTGIALSECFAMSQDNRLSAPTQLALNYIMQAQDPVGGGWRYTPRQPGDTSAVGWQIMALKSGNMASLQVNHATVKKAVEFLNSVESEGGSRYGYTDPSKPTPGRTAVGLLCRMYLGWKKDNSALQDGVAYLAKTGPTADLYYDYYATQVMHHVEGDAWVSWNKRMKELLLKAQATKDHEAGSWHTGFDRGHAAEAAGRLYCTSLATMILEVYYRHLPIYRTQSVDEQFRE